MLAGLEMRIREAQKHERQLGAGEEVGQELHRVGAQARDVLIAAIRRGRGGVLGAQGRDAIFHVLGDLRADLEAEDQFVGQSGREGDEEAAEAAAYVGDCDGFGEGFGSGVVGGWLRVWGDEGRVVGGPVHEGWACGAVEASVWLAVSGRGGDFGGGGFTRSVGGRRRDWRGLVAGRISSGGARRCLVLCGFGGSLRAFAACLLLSS